MKTFLNTLLRNIVKWSDALWKSCSICCKITTLRSKGLRNHRFQDSGCFPTVTVFSDLNAENGLHNKPARGWKTVISTKYIRNLKQMIKKQLNKKAFWILTKIKILTMYFYRNLSKKISNWLILNNTNGLGYWRQNLLLNLFGTLQ